MDYSKKFPRSNSKECRQYIRDEMKDNNSDYTECCGCNNFLDRMKVKVDSNAGDYCFDYNLGRRVPSTCYNKAKQYVTEGNFRISPKSISRFLVPIYGEDKVDSWNAKKQMDVYSGLIAREYDTLMKNRAKHGKK